MWRGVLQKARPLDDWLEHADSLLKDREDDVESLLKKHKVRWNFCSPQFYLDLVQLDFLCTDILPFPLSSLLTISFEI